MKHSGIVLLIITAVSLSACGGSEDVKDDLAGNDGPTTPNHPTSISDIVSKSEDGKALILPLIDIPP